jgi:hypothetical protein
MDRYIRETRLLLGLDAPVIRLADTVCGECQGPLVVAQDGSSDVECEWCGFVYHRNTWAQIAEDLQLVGTEDAVTFLCRDGLSRTSVKRALFRASAAGKIRNRGGSERGQALWSILELRNVDWLTCPS